ncbi:unnamed protein product, partial [Sphacelaria rigidula]
KKGDELGADEERPCMLFLDSLDMHQSNRIWQYLWRYLQMKWDGISGNKEMSFRDVFPLVRPKAPTQINGCDCGVYVLRYAQVRSHASR